VNSIATPAAAHPAAEPREPETKPNSPTPDRVLATVLYLRRLCTQTVLADLFGVDRSTITKAVREVLPLLHQHGHTVTPSTARFPTPADLTAFLRNNTPHPSKIKSTC
jgi:hypothetical protein